MSIDPKKQESHKHHHFSRDVTLGDELWVDGLICAFEFIRGNRKPHHSSFGLKAQSAQTSGVDKSQKPIFENQHFSKNGIDADLEAYDVDALDGQSQGYLSCLRQCKLMLVGPLTPLSWMMKMTSP